MQIPLHLDSEDYSPLAVEKRLALQLNMAELSARAGRYNALNNGQARGFRQPSDKKGRRSKKTRVEQLLKMMQEPDTKKQYAFVKNLYNALFQRRAA